MKQEIETKMCCHFWFEPTNFIQPSFLKEQSYKFPVGLDRLQIRCRLQNSCSLLNFIQISTRYDTLCLRIYLLPRLYKHVDYKGTLQAPSGHQKYYEMIIKPPSKISQWIALSSSGSCRSAYDENISIQRVSLCDLAAGWYNLSRMS